MNILKKNNSVINNKSPLGIRTRDVQITSPTHYHLSYGVRYMLSFNKTGFRFNQRSAFFWWCVIPPLTRTTKGMAAVFVIVLRNGCLGDSSLDSDKFRLSPGVAWISSRTPRGTDSHSVCIRGFPPRSIILDSNKFIQFTHRL